MDFKKATSELIARTGVEDIAFALGCSAAIVRQARLSETAKVRCPPPVGWEGPVAELAERNGYRLLRLSKALQRKGAK
jgi:hypothetical protein